ncbi:MAG TPA: hypothetical protein ENK65_03520, partial [Helicobacteraceae bacterium]|nr:hypothetical protein [Helicobacteraceae bacterium]
MSNVLGHLTDIIGTVQIKHADGTLELAVNNAVIVEGDTVVNSAPNSATIILNNGREVPVEGNSYTVVDMTMAGTVVPSDAQAEGEDLELALMGDDFDDIETAAGEENGSSTYYEAEYTERTGASNEIGVQGRSSSRSYGGGDINDYRTDEEFLNSQGGPAGASAFDASSRGNLEVSISTSFPGSSSIASSANVGAPSLIPSQAVSGVSDIDESQSEVYITFTSDRAFSYDTQLHFDFISGEGKAEWADDYIFPMQYTTDGGVTWQDMEAFNVTMEAGATELVLRVTIFDDGVVENTEQFLANVTSADFNAVNVDFNIHDNDVDDGTPLVAVDFAYVVEGMEYAEYHITLDKPAEGEVSINYYTADFGATAGEDYTPVSGTAVFSEGQTEVVVRVPIIDDTLIEGTELAFFNLDPNSLQGNAKLADIQGSRSEE